MQSLYVCLFSNGFVKVGRSSQPDVRVAQHVARLACLGVTLAESYVTECPDQDEAREQSLINRCVHAAKSRHQLEWFTGLNFGEVCKWAYSAAHSEFTDKPCDWQALFTRRDGFQTRLADRLGLAPQTVNNWRRLGIPVEYCARVEKECGGEFTRRDFRPLDWQLIWPELAA